MPDQQVRARRGRPPDLEARRRCVEITGEMLQEFGYAGLTMSELARRAGVSTKSLYTWWPDKAAIVAEAMAAAAEMVELPDLGDTEAELRALFAATLYLAQNSEIPLSMAVVHSSDERAAVNRGYAERLLARRREHSRALVRRCVDRGDLPADTDVDALLDLWNGFAVYRYLRAVAVTDHHVDQLISMALSGNVPRLP